MVERKNFSFFFNEKRYIFVKKNLHAADCRRTENDKELCVRRR